MTILDRYILKFFLINFVILFSVLFIFTCIVDLFVNINGFLESAEIAAQRAREDPGRLERFGQLLLVILRFYLPRLFQFYAYLVGLVTVGAMGFTLVQLHRHRELTAVLAAGVSLHRVALPIIVAAIGLNVLQFINREAVLPRYAPQLLRDHDEYGGQSMEEFRVPLLHDAHNRMFYARRYFPGEERMEQVVILVRDEALRLTHRIKADEATWTPYDIEPGADPPLLEHGPVVGEWTLVNGRLADLGEARGADIARSTPVASVPTNLDPTRLLLYRHREFQQMLNLRQIDELEAAYRMNQTQLDELARIRYGRFAQILINVLTLLLALPFFLVRSPVSPMEQSVKTAGLTIFAQVAGALGTAVGFPGIPPAASVFLVPLLILLPLSVALMSQVET